MKGFLTDIGRVLKMRNLDKNEFQALFAISAQYSASENTLIVSSHRQEINQQSYDSQFIATLDIDLKKFPYISDVIGLIKKSNYKDSLELPLVICGSFQLSSKKVTSLFEEYQPIVPVKIESVIVAFLKVPYIEIPNEHKKISSRLNSLITL